MVNVPWDIKKLNSVYNYYGVSLVTLRLTIL